MNYFYFILLASITIFLYILPFIPAWREWKNPKDAEPFLVNFKDASHADYTIRTFKEYVTNHRAEFLLNLSELPNQSQDLNNPDKIIFFNHSDSLANQLISFNKIYALQDLTTGLYNFLSEIYTEMDLTLASNTCVKKLVYSGNNLVIQAQVRLEGYAKAKTIRLQGPLSFQYLSAESIKYLDKGLHEKVELVDIISMNLSRMMANKPWHVPYNSKLAHHLIAKSSLKIGSNCQITGNIKGYKDVYIGAHSVISGAIISKKNIYIEDGCFIQGPVVASNVIKIGSCCTIGANNSKTTLSANTITIAPGGCIRGLILAKQQGNFL